MSQKHRFLESLVIISILILCSSSIISQINSYSGDERIVDGNVNENRRSVTLITENITVNTTWDKEQSPYYREF